MNPKKWEPWKTVFMPDGGQVCLASFGPDWPLFEGNHNIFRLGKDGNVIWRVKRDEGQEVVWAASREKAEADNSDSVWTNSPFTSIRLLFADGSTNLNPVTYGYPDADTWVEGASVQCVTYDSRKYDLDIETGVARLVFAPRRPW